ncbi:MAG: DUF6345 domain-containing protein [Candidatus Binatia bacterium]
MKAITVFFYHPFRVALLRAAIVTAICLLASAHAEAGEFGTRCQRSFQFGWQNTLPYMYDRCSGFNNELDDTDTKLFYYNLTGTGSGFTSNDGSVNAGGVDAVDLFYVSTHGGAQGDPINATLTLWGIGQNARSGDWRFGDNADGVRIFSQYACETLWIDNNSYNRWDQVFKGGMQLATGSHDKVYDGWTTDETGEDYADDLQSGKSVKWAWFDGNSDWWSDQDVAIYASSSGSLGECQVRRDYMTWQNLSSFPRLRDNNMNRICASWISDN